MRQNLSLLIIFFSSALSKAQADYVDIYRDAHLEKVKEIEVGYLATFRSYKEPKLQQKSVNPSDDFRGGIALFNDQLHFLWLYEPRGYSIVDFRFEKDTIYFLGVDQRNSKSSSSGSVMEGKLDLDGSLHSLNTFHEKSVRTPNIHFEAFYDGNDRIWTFTQTQGPQKHSYGVKYTHPDNVLVDLWTEELTSESSHLIESYGFKYDQVAASDERIVFIFQGDSVSVNYSNEFPAQSLCMISFDSLGNYRGTDKLGSPNIYVQDICVEGTDTYLAGEFAGSNGNNCEDGNFFLGKNLSSRSTPKRTDCIRNGFVACIRDNASLGWYRALNSKFDVSASNLSALGDSLILTLEYKNKITVAGENISSFNPSDYAYSDALICFFNTAGKLKGFEKLNGDAYDPINIEILPKYLVAYGRFTKRQTIFGNLLTSDHINDEHYLIFQPRN